MNNSILKSIVFIALLSILFACNKDEVVFDSINFEELTLEDNSFWNGSDGTGGFSSGNATFPNSYTKYDTYDVWHGFAYSNVVNITTKDYTNQYASIAGSGAEGSDNYALLYSFLKDTITFSVPEKITNISVSNSTYAYSVMKEGDDWGTPKMGGEDGKSQDYFKLIIGALDESGNTIGTGNLFLADFDSTRVSPGYVSNSWTDIDLSVFGYVKHLTFSFDSNIKNDFGILIPTYVCIDNIEGELESLD